MDGPTGLHGTALVCIVFTKAASMPGTSENGDKSE